MRRCSVEVVVELADTRSVMFVIANGNEMAATPNQVSLRASFPVRRSPSAVVDCNDQDAVVVCLEHDHISKASQDRSSCTADRLGKPERALPHLAEHGGKLCCKSLGDVRTSVMRLPSHRITDLAHGDRVELNAQH